MFFIFKGVKINYTVKGSGKDLLFLHGWGGSTQSFEAFENRLKNFRCINIDFPPFGNSDKLTEPWTVEMYARMVEELLKRLEVTEVCAIAHSFGARVAIMLCNNTNVITKLVLTGAAGIKPKASIKKQIRIMAYKISKTLVKMRLIKKERLKSFGSSDYKAADSITRQTIVNIVHCDETALLKNITVPTLLLWGRDDRETPLYMGRKFGRKIKDSALIVLDGSHFAYIENFEKVLLIIKSFLGEEYGFFCI